jgi:flagellar basal body-associated protein FliL
MLAAPKYLAALAVAAIVANAAAFYFLRHRSPATPPAKRDQAMVLGTFVYNRVSPRDKQVKHGQIIVTLHLAFSLDAAKFRAVHDQEKRLQDAVEDAMHRLRASDLSDPRYVRLRNRFQERLNEELGFEAIDDVIVTKAPEPSAADPTADSQAGDQQTADPQAPSGEPDATGGAASGATATP